MGASRGVSTGSRSEGRGKTVKLWPSLAGDQVARRPERSRWHQRTEGHLAFFLASAIPSAPCHPSPPPTF